MPEILSTRGRRTNFRYRRDGNGEQVYVVAPGHQVWERGQWLEGYARALDRRCTLCREWLEYTTENFYQHPTNGSVSARCRSCDSQARAGYSRPARGAAGTSRTGRIFGVELEITGPSDYAILESLRDHGIPVASGNQNGYAIGYQHTNTNRHVWTLKTDSSVHGRGLELVSPKLRGDAGFAELEKVCVALNEAGATVDASCGLHVHHDFRGLTLDQIKRQVLAMVDAQAYVMSMVAPSRRGNTYCPEWDTRHRQQVELATELHRIGQIGPRGVVNMWAYGEHGSVEIRAHAGTTNARKIAAWVRFGQAVFAAAEAGATLQAAPVAGVPVSAVTLQQFLLELVPYGLQATDIAWLMRFVTVGQTRQEVAERIAELIEVPESVYEEVAS